MRTGTVGGQEAIEVVLISILVFFSAISVVMVLGNKLATLFNGDSATSGLFKQITVAQIPVDNNYSTTTTNNNINNTSTTSTTNDMTTTNDTTTTSDTTTTDENTSTTTILGGQVVTVNDDGSLSFTVQGQNVNLSPQMIDLTNSVFETVGSSGMPDLIKEIAYMIEAHKDEYPNTEVPVEISFGTGTRTGVTETSTYQGKAIVNTTAVKVGKDLVVIQKDQSCTFTSANGSNCSYTGQYRIEGSIGTKNLFTGNVTSSSSVTGSPYGEYKATVDSTNGLNFKTDINNDIYYNQHYTNSTTTNWYDWNINFNNEFYPI